MNVIYCGFRRTLVECFGEDRARKIWTDAQQKLKQMKVDFPDIQGDEKMMILPAAALYQAMQDNDCKDGLALLKAYGAEIGAKIAKMIHGLTSLPGVSRLLWTNMPKLMRSMSSKEKGYSRRIISESKELVAVDILSCPLHNAAVKIGMPEVAQVVCAMDKAYMCGFKYIEYPRSSSVAEGGACCDYRLRFDKNKR